MKLKIFLPLALAVFYLTAAPPLIDMIATPVTVLLRTQSATANSSPPPFVMGALKCAVNVNRFRARLGLRTTKSAAAASFLSFRRVTRPRFGDVVVNRRPGGGHHAMIAAGDGWCFNPRQNKGWQKVRCNSVWRKMPKITLR